MADLIHDKRQIDLVDLVEGLRMQDLARATLASAVHTDEDETDEAGGTDA